MTHIVLFPSVLGVRQGVLDAADLLRDDGHEVLVADLYDGRVFDDYDEASEYEDTIGYPELMRRAVDVVKDMPDGFLTAGFSNGAAMAEHVATQRKVNGVVMLSGALDITILGAESWPAGTNAQIHTAVDDPFRDQAGIDAVIAQVRAAGGTVEAFDYPGAGHLFTDRSRAAEYDPTAAELLWSRVRQFCAAQVAA